MGVKNVTIFALFFLSLIVKGSAICPFNEFQCDSGECILLVRLCNGDADCPDGEDERYCPVATDSNTPCLPGYFICNDGQCIPQDNQCDGVPDCLNGEDESICS